MFYVIHVSYYYTNVNFTALYSRFGIKFLKLSFVCFYFQVFLRVARENDLNDVVEDDNEQIMIEDITDGKFL